MFDIGNEFKHIEQVKPLAEILLGDGEKVVRRNTDKVPNVRHIAREILREWCQQHPGETYGACLHAVLMDPRVGAESIAREYKDKLLEGIDSLLLNAALYCFLALNSSC